VVTVCALLSNSIVFKNLWTAVSRPYLISDIGKKENMADVFTKNINGEKYNEYLEEFQCQKVLPKGLALARSVDYYGMLTTDTECPTGSSNHSVHILMHRQ